MLAFGRIGEEILLNKLLFYPFFKWRWRRSLPRVCSAARRSAESKYWLCRAVTELFGESEPAPPGTCAGAEAPAAPGACPRPSVPVRTVCPGNSQYFVCLRLNAHAPPGVIYYMQHARFGVILGVVQRNLNGMGCAPVKWFGSSGSILLTWLMDWLVAKKSLMYYTLPEEYTVTECLLVFESLGSFLVVTEVTPACSENF